VESSSFGLDSLDALLGDFPCHLNIGKDGRVESSSLGWILSMPSWVLWIFVTFPGISTLERIWGAGWISSIPSLMTFHAISTLARMAGYGLDSLDALFSNFLYYLNIGKDSRV
jgi:hypothetical protein